MYDDYSSGDKYKLFQESQYIINDTERRCSKQRNPLIWMIVCGLLVIMLVLNIMLIIKMDSINKYNNNQDNVIICYYTTPNYSDPRPLLPMNINPNLCTHINVAFAQIKQRAIYLDENLNRTLFQIVKLKEENPNLKIMLSIGGASKDGGFPDMVINHASRKIFIKSVKQILRHFKLDGIDLDWEFPVMNSDNSKRNKRERQHFSQLLYEIKAEYKREKRNYLLSVAVAAPETIVDIAYDVDQLNLYADFVNIMTYDFHFYSKYTPFTGLNSPLYPRHNEHFYLSTLNINYTVHMYMKKGLDKNKIVVGIPTYGHSFTLVNSENTEIGSPASNFGSLGGQGFVLYPEICTFITNHKSDVKVVNDRNAKVPYCYRNQEWVSYESPSSVMEKAKYIRDWGLGGAMIYSLSADDHEGICSVSKANGRKFPLSQSIKNALLSP